MNINFILLFQNDDQIAYLVEPCVIETDGEFFFISS